MSLHELFGRLRQGGCLDNISRERSDERPPPPSVKVSKRVATRFSPGSPTRGRDDTTTPSGEGVTLERHYCRPSQGQARFSPTTCLSIAAPLQRRPTFPLPRPHRSRQASASTGLASLYTGHCRSWPPPPSIVPLRARLLAFAANVVKEHSDTPAPPGVGAARPRNEDHRPQLSRCRKPPPDRASRIAPPRHRELALS